MLEAFTEIHQMRVFCRMAGENWAEAGKQQFYHRGRVPIFNPRLIQLMFQIVSVMLVANFCGKGNSILNCQDGCISSSDVLSQVPDQSPFKMGRGYLSLACLLCPSLALHVRIAQGLPEWL